MMNNVGAMVAELQKRLQEELKNKTVEISEGGGAFKLVMDGQQQVVAVKFGPRAWPSNNTQNMEKIIMSAFNKAVAESKNMVKHEVAKLTGGMNLPDINGLF